jgi:hypothetical protein
MAALLRHLRRLRRHGAWLALSMLGLWTVQHLVPPAMCKATNEVGGNFLQTFGGMYGIVVAFAIYVVWQQHNDVQVAIEHEAVSLGELHRMIGFLTSWPERETVRTRLREYALAVPANNTPPLRTVVDEGVLLGASLDAFLGYKPGGPDEERLWSTVLELFHEVNEAREHRRTVARLRMGDGLRGFIVIGGVFTVGTLWLMEMDSFTMHAVLTALLTWVVVASASIVFDLDSPYTGDFIVDWRRFRELADLLVRS